MIAAVVFAEFEERIKRRADGEETRQSRGKTALARAAKMAGVTPHGIQDAKQVWNSGDAKLIDLVCCGSATMNKATQQIMKSNRRKTASKPPTKTPTTQDMKEAAVNIRAALQGQSHESRIRAELYKEESTVRGYLHVILQSYNDNAEWARILVTGNGGPKLLKKLIEE